MINISKELFYELKDKNKTFSLISTFRGDYLTPINIYKSFKGKYKFLLESGSDFERSGRYSFLGENPKEVYFTQGNKGFKYIKKFLEEDFYKESNEFPFKGGLISFISYEAVRDISKKLKSIKTNDFEDVGLAFYDEYICYDSFNHKVSFISNINSKETRSYEEIKGEHKEKLKEIKNFKDLDLESSEEKKEVIFDSLNSREEFIEKVKKAKNLIEEGEIFQVVLSLKEKCKRNKEPFEIYRKLREDNPSSYMFLLEFEKINIIGSSPESLVSLKDNIVKTNPIAGTRPRGKTLIEDKKLEEDLLKDEKEKAEHVMLVDLGRNDINKVSKFKKTEVTSFMEIKKFSCVMHISSVVRGEILDNKDSLDALIACFPAGTVSGAPKIRAMEIIDEIEDFSRGIYSGSVGYFSYGGNMDMSIAIRTIVVRGDECFIQGGAGIVYDSVPETEYEEIKNKIKALKEALLW